MTTVTPSDQAGAASAKRPATIPTQRSGQGLRLLVLGTGEGAAAFRALAGEAGAELAQRFSVRVTHVVVDEGVGDDDARVVRARTAGLPVLGLAEGARLVEERVTGVSGVGEANVAEGAAEAEGEAVGAGMGDAAANATDVDAGSVRADGAGAADSSTDADVRAGDVGAREGRAAEAEAATEDSGAGVEGAQERVLVDHVEAVPLIRPRAEVVPEPVDGGPSDVFSGSALEAMLQFPPLPADEFEGGDGGADAAVDAAADVDADLAEVGPEPARAEVVTAEAVRAVGDEAQSVLMDVASAACACVETEVGAADGQVDVGGDELVAAGDRGGAVGADGERSGAWTASSVAWALVPLVSLGLLTPVAIGYAAYRLRSRNLAVATACYSLAIVAVFAVSAVLPVHARAQSVIGDLMTTCLAASWLGGTAHSFMLRRRVFK